MKRPDFWNWPPFMTVSRHNRIMTDVIAQAQAAVSQEHARATREGKTMVHRFMVDANAALYAAEGTGVYVARVRAVFQSAEHEFRPVQTDVKEAIDAAVRP